MFFRFCASELLSKYRKLGSIMTGHSIRKVCILETAIAWVIIFMGLSTMRTIKNTVVKYNVSLLTMRDLPYSGKIWRALNVAKWLKTARF